MLTRRLARLLLGALVLLVSAGSAAANWTASGVFQYVDREYDANGFTGNQSNLPVRSVDLEIVDANASGKNSVLATGTTGPDGSFSIQVQDNSTRDVYVRAITRSTGTPDLFIEVRQTTASKAVYYAVATSTVTGHAPSVNVDFGTAVITPGQGGEAFNLYDQMLKGTDYIAYLFGSRPGPAIPLYVVWGVNNGVGGSAFIPGSDYILLRDSAGYDDTVILHEMGHYVIRKYSATNTPGGFHTFSLCDEEIRLAYDEGVATFWGNMTLCHFMETGCNVYVRTNGGSGPGNLVRNADLETDNQYLCKGSTNEVNVTAVLWDILDGPATPDTTPGVDDAQDALNLPDGEVWEVMSGYMVSATTRTLEDFWDGWFLPPAQNGHKPEMLEIASYVGIDYEEDASEVNDTAAQAFGVDVNGGPVHATLFRDPDGDGAGSPDTDWYSFAADTGTAYVIETQNLISDGDTYLRLYDTDGALLLATNGNRATGDKSSRIDWTAPQSGVYFAQVTHDTGNAQYGGYDFLVSTLNPVDNDNDGYATPGDCNDADPAIHPGATEYCDGLDQNCDGVIDDGFDVDGDGFTLCGADCDDADANINPNAVEIPGNGIDDNCNGLIDELSRQRRRIYDVPVS